MLRLLYRLMVQRAKQARARRHALRQSQARQKQPAVRARRSRKLVISTVIVVVLGLFVLVFHSHFEISTPTTDPNRAQMEIRLDSIKVAPVLIYLEQSYPPLTPVPENDDISQIIIEDNQFIPTFQIISPGSTIEIENRDDILHNTHVIDGDDTVFNVATPLKSVTVRKIIKSTGMLTVRCDLHPFMHAWMFVPSNPFYELVREPKSIRWTDIAPGEYRLRIWEAGTFRQEISVTLAASKRKSVRVL